MNPRRMATAAVRRTAYQPKLSPTHVRQPATPSNEREKWRGTRVFALA